MDALCMVALATAEESSRLSQQFRKRRRDEDNTGDHKVSESSQDLYGPYAQKSSQRVLWFDGGSGTTVKDLKRRCKAAGLAVSGTKQELASRLAAARGATEEAVVVRMRKPPLHAGAQRQGSLRVVATDGSGPALVLHETYASSRATWRVVPGPTPIAVSVLRHDRVFSTHPSHATKSPSPICPCCEAPAEVWDVSEGRDNPLHAHLNQAGLLTSLPPDGPLFLRVCRQGCLTYEGDCPSGQPIVSLGDDDEDDDDDDDDDFHGIQSFATKLRSSSVLSSSSCLR